MSRHSYTGRDGIPRVDIGWDRPLGTYFVQVFHVENGEEVAFLWEGAEHGQITEAAAAVKIAAQYAELPPSLTATLEIDRLRTSAQTDGPAQSAAKRWRFYDPKDGPNGR